MSTGQKPFDEEAALANLLDDGTAWVGYDDSEPRRVVVDVLVSDIFVPAADSEPMLKGDLELLTAPDADVCEWAMRRRNLKPWWKVEKRMRATGQWKPWMDDLDDNDAGGPRP